MAEEKSAKMELKTEQVDDIEEALKNSETITPQHPVKRQRKRKRRHSETVLTGTDLNNGKPSTTYNEKAVKILDNLLVPEVVLRTMARGQSFVYPKYNTIRNLAKDEQLLMAKIIKDYKETKEYLKQNPDTIITTADKGNIAIIHKRETFIAYRTEHLNANLLNGTYTIIADADRNHVGTIVEERFAEVIKEIGNDIGLGNATADEILEKLGCPLSEQDRVFVPGRLFGKLKIHKDVIGYRPLVDISVRFGRPLEEYMQRMLSALLNRYNEYNIKSTQEFILKLKGKFSCNLLLPSGHVMMKIDFENMFTNVPTETALEIIKGLWNEYVAEEAMGISGQTACKVIEFFIKEASGFFTSDGVLYMQEKGLVMGASLSSSIAALLINNTILKVKPFLQEKTFITVYADDIMIIGDPTDVGRVMQNFSHYLPDMPYRLEKESFNSRVKNPIFTLRYLEVLLYRQNERNQNMLSSIWDYEEYHSLGTLNCNSYDSFYTKKGVIIRMLVKAITYTTTKPLMQAALELWTDILQINDYPIVFMKTVASDFIDKKLTEGTSEKFAYRWAKKFMNGINMKKYKKGKFPKRDIGNTSIYRHVKGGYWHMDRQHDKESTVFTKIKDILPPEYMFNKIVTWKCDILECRVKFIAKIEHSSLKDTIIEIVENPSSSYYKHVVEAHSGISPEYPKNIRSKIGSNETNELNSLMQIEIAANPKLIVANTDFTINSEAGAEIKKELDSQPINAASGEAMIKEEHNIPGPSH